MIIIFIGGIGSGKTLSAVKEIADSKGMAYTNFRLKNYKSCHRLKVSDIVRKDPDDKKNRKVSVNWGFWEEARKKGHFSIYLDELHNIASSRRSMSGFNIAISRWLSQIRKILSDSQDSHLYLITQRLNAIDIQFRDLAQLIVVCRSAKFRGKVYIRQNWYDGLSAFETGKRGLSKVFTGNNYFKYYDTTEMVTFSDAEEFI